MPEHPGIARLLRETVSTLLIENTLNGLQLGVAAFLLAAGLTLVFGIMNFVNLAHGSLYMMGAYFAAARFRRDRLVRAAASSLAFVGTLAARHRRSSASRCSTLYARDHLDQVLATFGLILFFNELVRIIWGPARLYMRTSAGAGSAPVEILLGLPYPSTASRSSPPASPWRSASAYLIRSTRIGMLIRAGAIQPAHGRRARRQHRACSTRWCSGSGAALAGLAGLMAGADPRRCSRAWASRS